MREDVRRRRTAVKPPTLSTPEYACALLGKRGSRVRSLGTQGSDLGEAPCARERQGGQASSDPGVTGSAPKSSGGHVPPHTQK